MLSFKDFHHLPRLDVCIQEMLDHPRGLMIVAGLDARPLAGPAAFQRFLPSGRATIFRTLLAELLLRNRAMRAVIVARDKSSLPPPRELRRRVDPRLVEVPHTYASRIAQVMGTHPDLLVVDELSLDSLLPTFEAAQTGVRILTQMDTIFHGHELVRQLNDLDVPAGHLRHLSWVLGVQRQPTLCPACKHPALAEPGLAARLQSLCPGFDPSRTYYQSAGCAACEGSGRQGDAAVFDLFHYDPGAQLSGQTSRLPAREYLLELAGLGDLPLEDVCEYELNRLRAAYTLMTANEDALTTSNASLQRKLLELESANRVLQQRTGALFSLEEIGQTLIASSRTDDLAQQICRHARELCGANRAILYFYRPENKMEVLAVGGWDKSLVRRQFDSRLAPLAVTGRVPVNFNRLPPGIENWPPEDLRSQRRIGLAVPLVAEGRAVGLMVVNASGKLHFLPGEIALLQTFANQAAVALQRVELIEELRAKIVQLEAAQAELVQKERMQRELELARQLQQSVLPRTFPPVAGYRFAATNQPARQVGGDFYDAFRLDEDHFGLVIADVSDKGMPAAIYMALSRSLLLAEARRELSPRAALHNVNRLLLELGEPSMFVTVFYGVVDMRARRLTYTRAGHDRPLLLRGGHLQELSGQGTVLGFMEEEELHLSQESLDLLPGDRLVLYTDGLSDLRCPAGTAYQREALLALFQQFAALHPQEICQAAFDELARFQAGAEQADDMTLLVMEVL